MRTVIGLLSHHKPPLSAAFIRILKRLFRSKYRRRRSLLVAFVTGATVFGILQMIGVLAAGTMNLISINVGGTAAGNSVSSSSKISADGRYVAFSSNASNLVANDDNFYQDGFVRDRQTNTTRLVSVNSSGTGAGNGASYVAGISADGRYVVFQSEASNLVTNDPFTGPDIFVRDLQTNTTRVVSINIFGSAANYCYDPIMTPDGRYVIFETSATNLVVGLNAPISQGDLYRRDLETGTTILISANNVDNRYGNGASRYPFITRDGRFVTFTSESNNLVSSISDAVHTDDVFIRDVLSGTTSAISLTAAGTATGNNRSFTSQVSEGGRYVVFKSLATNLVPNDDNAASDIFVRDRQTGITSLVTINAAGTGVGFNYSDGARISADGRYVFFYSKSGNLVVNDNNNVEDVFVRDLQTNTTSLVSINNAGLESGNGTSQNSEITSDARYVLFVSNATNLTSYGFAGYQIFVRDMQAGTTALVTIGINGNAPNSTNLSEVYAITPDGRHISFGSVASNFTTVPDYNDTYDVFVHDAAQSRPVSDFDGDGKTDIAVYRAGSTPNAPSYWHVLQSSDNLYVGLQFGAGEDKIVPADFDGDGKSNFAVWRPSTGTWYTSTNAAINYGAFQWGASGDIPVPGDYDGDGKSDHAVFRPSNGYWYVRRSSDGGFVFQQFGINGDKPLLGDFDADGKTDFAYVRISGNDFVWSILQSSNGAIITQPFGLSTDKAVPADYDGDGRANIAVFRPSTGRWYTSTNPAINYGEQQWGANGDVPVMGDFDGDGRADLTVFRPGTTVWYALRSSNGGVIAQQWGLATDSLVPAAFIP